MNIQELETLQPPDEYSTDLVPAAADAEWRGELSMVSEEVDEPLPISSGDETADQLCRIVRSHAKLDDQEQRLDAYYQAMKKWLANRRAALTYSCQQQAYNLAVHLISLQGGKKRSIDTPYGRCGFRKVAERLAIRDNAAIIEAAMTDKLPAACVQQHTTTRVVASEVQKLYKETGEVPPGCVIEPETDTFYIR